tara:strand:+ start:63 stop:482 length:420 start_codon:yes stop_codon:yes gene_type:complete
MPDEAQEFLWERYKQAVDLHRGYLDLAIKLNGFNYAITGAIISFYFATRMEEPLVHWSLLLPFLMNMGLVIFFFRSALAARLSQQDIHKLANALQFDVRSVVASVLEFLLWVFFSTTVVIAVGILVLILNDFNVCKFVL